MESAVSTEAGDGGEETGTAIAGLRVKREKKSAVTVTPVMKVALRKDRGVGFTIFVILSLEVS